jgi:hypothetical protein
MALSPGRARFGGPARGEESCMADVRELPELLEFTSEQARSLIGASCSPDDSMGLDDAVHRIELDARGAI